MKTVYTWLVAGMLATATVAPVQGIAKWAGVHASNLNSDDVLWRILTKAAPLLSQQLGTALSAEILHQAYQDGDVQIIYLGYSGAIYTYRVVYMDGGVGIADIDEF